jgi:hypothetical protein
VSVLRLFSANVRLDLVGVDRLPADAGSMVHGVLAHLEAGPPEVRAAEVTVNLTDLVPRVSLRGELLPEEPDCAAARVVSAVDRALLGATSCLALHAAAVDGARGAVIMPGPSGAGKSTLTGACLQLGLRLVSDEAACLDPKYDVLWPHPRPLGLDQRARDLLRLQPPAHGPADEERATAPLLLGAVADPATAARPVAVVIPERGHDGAATLEATTTGDGLAALLASCLNAGSSSAWPPELAWERLVRLAQGLPVYRMRYDGPHDGAEAIAPLVA